MGEIWRIEVDEKRIHSEFPGPGSVQYVGVFVVPQKGKIYSIGYYIFVCSVIVAAYDYRNHFTFN